MQAACKLVGVLGLPALEQVLDQQQLLLCDDHRKTNDRAISKMCDEVAINNTIQLSGPSRNAVDLARQKQQASQAKKEATRVKNAHMYDAVVEQHPSSSKQQATAKQKRATAKQQQAEAMQAPRQTTHQAAFQVGYHRTAP